ncbi:MAG: YbjN domain-containing protein [Candidatus Eremiobacterota bacterium]
MKKTFIWLVLALSLGLSQAGWSQPPATPPAGAPSKLEELLKKAEIEYSPLDGGEFKIPVTIDNETVVVVAREGYIGDGTVETLKLIHFYTLVTEVKGGNASAPFLKKMAEINDGIYIGKVSMGSDGGIFYSSSLWLHQADPELLVNELVLAFIQRQQMRKSLQPFLEEG